jgi:hypothetical protein
MASKTFLQVLISVDSFAGDISSIAHAAGVLRASVASNSLGAWKCGRKRMIAKPEIQRDQRTDCSKQFA